MLCRGTECLAGIGEYPTEDSQSAARHVVIPFDPFRFVRLSQALFDFIPFISRGTVPYEAMLMTSCSFADKASMILRANSTKSCPSVRVHCKMEEFPVSEQVALQQALISCPDILQSIMLTRFM